MGTVSDAETINNVATDPVPQMAHPLSTEVQLIRGIMQTLDDGSSKWHDLAVVRELTGEDEEFLAGIEVRPDLTYVEYMSKLLARAVVSIGDLEVAKMPAMLDKLILADRDLLFLGVMKATYGRSREFRVTCQKCSESNDVGIDLDTDFPVKQPDFNVRSPIAVTLRNGEVVNLRLQNGEDLIAVSKKAASDAAINTQMIARCAVWNEGEAPADPLEWARKLNVADRHKLVNTLMDIEIGPSMSEVNTQCAHCGADMPIRLDWVSLLLS